MLPTLGALASLLLSQAAPVLRTPVVLELFSSEGCSSCPDAEALLSDLAANQPVAGAKVIALELHVDYWNRLGWVDPFSDPEYTVRQERYTAALDVMNVYTPQLVVDGSDQVVGSDRPGARRAITAAAARPHPAGVHLTPRAGRLEIEVAHANPGDLVVLALTELQLTTRVPRGENAGRTLQHGPVVRVLKQLGVADSSGAFSQEYERPSGLGAHARAVVLAQDPRHLQIHGASEVEFPP